MNLSTVKLVGAIDEGTSSARFILFRAGTDDIICSHQLDVPSIYPKEGWCEQDPQVILNIVIKCIDETIRKLESLGGLRSNVLAVGITNQRESTVVWNRDSGKPLHNAIIWLDNRTSSTVDELVNSIPGHYKNIDYLRPLCGLPLSPYFSALKLCWLRDNVPIVKKAMDDGKCLFGTIDCWLLYNLTGAAKGGLHLTDVTNASRTMLMNLRTLSWDNNLLRFFRLPVSMLPEIRSSAENYGKFGCSLLKGIPITAILGDQQAALVGQQCLKSGLAKSTYGTGCFLLFNTGESLIFSQNGLLTTVGYQLGPTAKVMYALEGSVAIAGASLSWLRDNMGLIESMADVETMALSVPDSNDICFVPAFSGLFAPYWNQEARGVICGLTENTTSEHIVRATLEAVCFQVLDILDVMDKDSGQPLSKLMVDGGMTVNDLFIQMQSDLIGINVVVANIPETTALGVALAAYSAVEPKFNINAKLPITKKVRSFWPQIHPKKRKDRYRRWKTAVEKALNWDTTTADMDQVLIFDLLHKDPYEAEYDW